MKKKLTFRGKVRKIYGMIKDPSRHCIKSFFKDKYGYDTALINACYYCIIGAGMKINLDYGDPFDDKEFFKKLAAMIGDESLAYYNDNTPHAEIIRTLRKIGWNTK
jgi:hypothetical protein